MPHLKRVCAASALVLLLCAVALAGGRSSQHSEGAMSLSQLAAAGAQPMSKAQVLEFIASHNGRLSGDIGGIKDSLRFFDDGTVRGESSSSSHPPTPGSGSWSLDADGVLSLSVTWKYGDKLAATGKLYSHGDYVYQMDGRDASRSWLYRFRR